MRFDDIRICPHARGCIPQELSCGLRLDRDRGLPWWKGLWRSLRGDYDCATEGTLPCPVASECDKEKKT